MLLDLIYCIFGITKTNKRNIWLNNTKIYFVGNKEITFFKNASSSSSQEIDASIWLVCEYVCYLKNMKCCGWLMRAYLEKRYQAGSYNIFKKSKVLQNGNEWWIKCATPYSFLSFSDIQNTNHSIDLLIIHCDLIRSKLRHEKNYYHVTELRNVYRDTYPFMYFNFNLQFKCFQI